MAWKNESRRHALASKGIKTGTKSKPVMKVPVKIPANKPLPKLKKKALFYFKEIRNNPTRYGGRNVTVEVFQHTKDGMESVGEVGWNTASYKGDTSEIFSYLVERGKIPKKYLNASQTKNGGGGYYWWTFKEDYNIHINEL